MRYRRNSLALTAVQYLRLWWLRTWRKLFKRRTDCALLADWTRHSDNVSCWSSDRSFWIIFIFITTIISVRRIFSFVPGPLVVLRMVNNRGVWSLVVESLLPHFSFLSSLVPLSGYGFLAGCGTRVIDCLIRTEVTSIFWVEQKRLLRKKKCKRLWFLFCMTEASWSFPPAFIRRLFDQLIDLSLHTLLRFCFRFNVGDVWVF